MPGQILQIGISLSECTTVQCRAIVIRDLSEHLTFDLYALLLWTRIGVDVHYC